MIGTRHISFCFMQKSLGEISHAPSDLTANTLPQSSLQHARRRILRSRILRASKLVPETLFTNITMATFETLFASSARRTSPPTTEAQHYFLPNSAYDHRTDQLRCFGSSRPILAGQSREKICRPTHASLHEPHTRTSLHQYNPCRGSSIGRACGSYNSKEINLKVEGSSPSFGYSYIKVPSGSCSFAFCWKVTTG
jgi:hypothetical protein